MLLLGVTLGLRLLGGRVSRRAAWRVARDQQWDSLLDAEHFAIAKLQADAFVTVDRGMAARAGKLVRIESVDALMAAG